MADNIQERSERAQEVLRAVWTIVSATNRDAVADDVERMGKALSAALEAKDFKACETVLAEVNSWMHQFAGVIMSRCEYIFDPSMTKRK